MSRGAKNCVDPKNVASPGHSHFFGALWDWVKLWLNGTNYVLIRPMLNIRYCRAKGDIEYACQVAAMCFKEVGLSNVHVIWERNRFGPSVIDEPFKW